MQNLALIYIGGKQGIEKNYEKAIKLYTKSANLGNAYSLNNLATIYENGKLGVEKNVEKALYLYNKAVRLNHVTSINNLANIYYFGKSGVKKDLNKASELYLKAAELNSVKAMFFLSDIFENKSNLKEVQTDYDKSTFFLFKALENNSNQCDKEFFESHLLERIQRLKVNWKKEYHSFWKSEKGLNQQIITILLISKFRSLAFPPIVSKVLVKGITLNIVKFLCHFRQFFENRIERVKNN